MKKIICCFSALIISPLLVAEPIEDQSLSKEQIHAIKALSETKKIEQLNKNNSDGQKPRLEDFASYNDFLKAIYLYKKNEEDTLKPNLEIKPPHPAVKNEPLLTPIEDNKDITIWGEELPSDYVILGD